MTKKVNLSALEIRGIDGTNKWAIVLTIGVLIAFVIVIAISLL